jgi:hypothetical protein
MVMKMKKTVLVSLVLFLSIVILGTYGAGAQENLVVNSKEKKEVIDSIAKLLKDNYVFPDMGVKLGEHIIAKHKKGDYNNFNDVKKFAVQLTSDLREVSKDLHLRVIFNPRAAKEQLYPKKFTDKELEAKRNWRLTLGQLQNFGFENVKILDGNIGYLKLTGFFSLENAGPTAVATMNFLANTFAVIIDLRESGGGTPQMSQLLASYFLGKEPVLLNSIYTRVKDETNQYWSLPHVPGKMMTDTDVFLLTSKDTFSAPEGFAYMLQQLKRATVIGETTRGGAHPGETKPVNERFLVWIPLARAINPISKTNWEGVGVKPDIETTKEQALKTAHIEALKKAIEKEKRNNIKEGLKGFLEEISKTKTDKK